VLVSRSVASALVHVLILAAAYASLEALRRRAAARHCAAAAAETDSRAIPQQ
jgi:hypothetical protein